MTSHTKVYTLEEASQHNTRDDCWVVLDGKVYNVTEYLDEHPGGDDVLLNATGRDAIEDFEFVGHSKNARGLMQMYCIGELDKSSQVIPQQKVTTKKQTTELSQKSTEASFKYWVIPAAIISISVVAGLFYFPK
ncbi:Cytochrome b5-like heme/steroid binding domain [Macleaya cordata]|uniref:Cytochrome b5-like heme/steroid binding domain n=1 Tax=Macleaya cordata TaxID=56857 RepID=A0A200QVX4_MACCD|nr:Cytochrome b5-like heme/steroid binding domain [Macleaya cordata]